MLSNKAQATLTSIMIVVGLGAVLVGGYQLAKGMAYLPGEVRWTNPPPKTIEPGGTASCSGKVGYLDRADRFNPKEGWTVQLFVDGSKVTTTTSGSDGSWKFNGIEAYLTPGTSSEVWVRYPGSPVYTSDETSHVSVLLKKEGETGTPPVADFTYKPTMPLAGEDVTFVSKSDPRGGEITSWRWEFGDGDSAEGQKVTHRYSEGGRSYTVKLTVTDSEGLSATDVDTITVVKRPAGPKADFEYSPEKPMADETVRFDGRFSVPGDTEITSYSWAFGDGTTAEGSVVEHAYGSQGTYDVTLTVTNDLGQKNSVTKSVSVSKRVTKMLVARFTIKPKKPHAGGKVTFDASGTEIVSAKQAISYEWRFGDGSKATGQKVTHKYSESGEYVVTLTASTGTGLFDKTERRVYVEERPLQLKWLWIGLTAVGAVLAVGGVLKRRKIV